MRILPILTAALVMAVLYLAVFERDRLMGMAGAAPETAPAPEAAAAPAASEPAPVSVVALRSTARGLASGVLLRGETQAAREVEMRAETSGQIVSVPLRKGAAVEAGTLLCEIDEGTRGAALAEAEARLPEARARLIEARARLPEAEARLAEAELTANAARRLGEDGFASATRIANADAALSSAEAGVEGARTGILAAEAGLKAAQAAIEAAERELGRTRITAPFAGLLETDTAETGALMTPGALCATIIALDPIRIVGFVPETEIDRLAPGARAGARLATGRELAGTVSFLSRAADRDTRTFRVEIEVPNPNLSIRDGQTAEIVIEAEGERAHLLPASALTLDDDGRLGLRIVVDGRAGFAPVSLLRDTPEGVWVAGLEETAAVIVTGQDYVTEGVPVAVTWRDAGE
ncbi:MAG: efflux RND transporter periplasmic adaptor subunit [Rhodobacteraceae bacterium]|nr:efflux RND transporter periplasmic adaptor subunit [Paracoccaceae bacterium]